MSTSDFINEKSVFAIVNKNGYCLLYTLIFVTVILFALKLSCWQHSKWNAVITSGCE